MIVTPTFISLRFGFKWQKTPNSCGLTNTEFYFSFSWNPRNKYRGFYLVSLLCKTFILLVTSFFKIATSVPAIMPCFQPAEKRKEKDTASSFQGDCSKVCKPLLLIQYLISYNSVIWPNSAVKEANKEIAICLTKIHILFLRKMGTDFWGPFCWYSKD